MRRGAFSTGFAFKYKRGQNDEMSVEPIHKNLKDEVLQSGHLTAVKWMKLVEVKARKYLNTKRVKTMSLKKDWRGKEIAGTMVGRSHATVSSLTTP